MKRIILLLTLLLCLLPLVSRAQVTSNVFVQTATSGDFATVAGSQPLIFNLADFSWYYWNGSAFTIYPAVQSVNTRTGAVTLTSADVGLGNVDNTSDATKNAASVTLTNKTISGASNTISAIAESSITNLVSDLALKAALASPTFTGTPLSTTAAVDTNTTQIATTAYVVGNAYSKAASPTFTGTLTETGVTDNFLNRTITAIGTTGNVTINKPAGTVNFAAGAGTGGVTVTNSIVTVNSLIFPVVRTNDATCSVKNIVASAGSFIIRMNANCTAATSIGFFVTN